MNQLSTLGVLLLAPVVACAEATVSSVVNAPSLGPLVSPGCWMSIRAAVWRFDGDRRECTAELEAPLPVLE